MLSAADTAAERTTRRIAENEASDLDFLADQIDLWKNQLEDLYPHHLTDGAAEVHDALSNMAGRLRRAAEDARF